MFWGCRACYRRATLPIRKNKPPDLGKFRATWQRRRFRELPRRARKSQRGVCFSRGSARSHAAANFGGHKRAAGVSVLQADVQLLLLAQEALPGQARAVGHAVRVRVLPPQVQDEELADDAQEPPTSRHQRHAEAAAEDDGDQERAGHEPAAAAAAVRGLHILQKRKRHTVQILVSNGIYLHVKKK